MSGSSGLRGSARPVTAAQKSAERIWALRFNLTTYDAWYVACAKVLAVPLATLDARLTQAPGPSCGFLLPDPGPASPEEPP